MAKKVLHRQQCAAITNGCTAAIVWEELGRDSLHRDSVLKANGWRLDHGRWICGGHEVQRPAHTVTRKEQV
jgi:hypothetical protein